MELVSLPLLGLQAAYIPSLHQLRELETGDSHHALDLPLTALALPLQTLFYHAPLTTDSVRL